MNNTYSLCQYATLVGTQATFSIEGIVDLADNQANVDAVWLVTFAEAPCPQVAFGGDIAQLDSEVFFVNNDAL